jgi:broad specificity phosphatase PhoE
MRAHVVAFVAALVAQLAAGAAAAQQEVILVRHAELQSAAMAAPKFVHLSEDGKARAGRLASLLRDSGVAAIYVTDFERTQETAAPLAHELARPVTIVPKGDPRELVQRLRMAHAGQTVLIVGHTDTLPGLIKALGHPAEIRIDAQDYGNVFIVTPRAQGAAGFLRLRY